MLGVSLPSTLYTGLKWGTSHAHISRGPGPILCTIHQTRVLSYIEMLEHKRGPDWWSQPKAGRVSGLGLVISAA